MIRLFRTGFFWTEVVKYRILDPSFLVLHRHGPAWLLVPKRGICWIIIIFRSSLDYKHNEHSQSRTLLWINGQSRTLLCRLLVGPIWLAPIRSVSFLGPRCELIGRNRNKFWTHMVVPARKVQPIRESYLIGWEVNAGPPTTHPLGVSKNVSFLGPRVQEKKKINGSQGQFLHDSVLYRDQPFPKKNYKLCT